MERVSTNLTLMYKLFIPVFWTVFFGLFTSVIVFSSPGKFGTFSTPAFKIGVGIFFLLGIFVLSRTIMKLLRVEMSDDQVYASNYFKAARYNFEGIDKLEEQQFLWMKIVRLHLYRPGIFGSRITFVASPARYRNYWKAHSARYQSLKVDQ